MAYMTDCMEDDIMYCYILLTVSCYGAENLLHLEVIQYPNWTLGHKLTLSILCTV